VGEKLRESMVLGCSSFDMKTVEEFDMTSNLDFLLTEPESLFDILAGHEANGQELPLPAIICVCSDSPQKISTEARIRKDFPSLHGIIEVMAQPCGPRKLAASLLEGQTRATQRADSLQAEPLDLLSPENPTPGPKILVQRSTSDYVRGNNASGSTIPPPSFAAAHSPLISATMPTTSVPLASLSQSQIPDTPVSETPTEYFPTSRVLLVDDNAINLRLLVVFAQRQELRYESALDGLQALNKFKTEAMASETPARPFDFVLMDLQMPVMGGLESTRKIREFEMEHGLQKSTIVALTGLASEKDQQDAVDAGVDMYLVKPVKFADIKRVFGTR
jgi:CheY-like chemotaxis protein